MCGITGFLGDGSIDDLARMTDLLVHRGPDAKGLWHLADHRIYLGHRRLSILDLTDGAQPMHSREEDVSIVFNGEIYNHVELRQELKLKGYSFQTSHSDTEVLLNAYKEWGENMTAHLNGMWSFVLYDKNIKSIFCSRDRFGEKPFYYTLQNGCFAFASEIQALRAHRSLQLNISKHSLMKYFAYGFIPSPLSIYENTYKLPAGHSLRFSLSNHTLEIKKYWDLSLSENSSHVQSKKITELAEELRALLSHSVKQRMLADVPVGVFLSGGIDSSTISALAQKSSPTKNISTFNIGFNESSFDESVYAKSVAGFLSTDHHQRTLSIDHALEILPDIAKKLDEPMADSSIIPTYLLSKFAREKVTVALGGDGGDELFAGYDPFRALNLASYYERWVPEFAHRTFQAMISHLPVSHSNMSIDFKLKRTLRGLSFSQKYWYPVWMGPLSHQEIEELFGEKIDIDQLYSEALQYWDQSTGSLVDRFIYLYTKLYLADNILTKVDRASMMHSLEVRAPFLDYELVQWLNHVPSNFKLHHGKTKYILKESMKQLLPNNIIHRTKKGFGVPIGQWFKDGRIEIDSNFKDSFLNPKIATSKAIEHQQGKADHRFFLWSHWLYTNWTKGKT